MADVSSFESRETALTEINKRASSIVTRLGNEGLDAILKEVDRLYPAPKETPLSAPIFGQGNFTQVSIDDRITQLKQIGMTKDMIRTNLAKSGYPLEEVRKRTDTVFDNIEDIFGSTASFIGNLFK